MRIVPQGVSGGSYGGGLRGGVVGGGRGEGALYRTVMVLTFARQASAISSCSGRLSEMRSRRGARREGHLLILF